MEEWGDGNRTTEPPTERVMSNRDVVVRRAVGEDWARLKAIRLEALADSPAAYGSTLESAQEFSDKRWRAMAEQFVYYLAEHNGRVVGMASGGGNDEHPGTKWLYGMYVTPSARGGGAAYLLVDAVATWARAEGATELYLHVTSSLARAKAFYEKAGFEANGERHLMDRDPSLELITMVGTIVDA
jgi:GNAT superfamily N-acetyltransferase